MTSKEGEETLELVCNAICYSVECQQSVFSGRLCFGPIEELKVKGRLALPCVCAPENTNMLMQVNYI